MVNDQLEKQYSKEILEKARKIKVLILDVDGVLTDGTLIYGKNGEQLKRFNVKDGLGVHLLERIGIESVIVTAMASGIVKRRAKAMKIKDVYQNFHDKEKALKEIKKKYKVNNDELCFIGDDVIDIPILIRVGMAVCPVDAVDEVKNISHLVIQRSGGNGAVRELADLIINAQGKRDQAIGRYYL